MLHMHLYYSMLNAKDMKILTYKASIRIVMSTMRGADVLQEALELDWTLISNLGNTLLWALVVEIRMLC